MVILFCGKTERGLLFGGQPEMRSRFLLSSGCRILAGDQILPWTPSSGGAVLIGGEGSFSVLTSGRMVLGRRSGSLCKFRSQNQS